MASQAPSTTADPCRELTVVLADDEPLAREGLRLALSEMAGVRLLASTADADTALAAVETHRPDVLLLDIKMPGQSGMALARGLARASPPDVVFVTAFQDYAREAFDVEAMDFLLKPVDPDRLREAIDRAWRRKAVRRLPDDAMRQGEATAERATGAYAREFWIPSRGGATRVATAAIQWIEAAGDYVLLHTALRTHIHRITMAKLAQDLDPDVMLRVHRSAFVNAAQVTDLVQLQHGNYALKLEGGAQVRVGRVYAASVRARLLS